MTQIDPSAAGTAFVGRGEIAGRSWWRGEHDEVRASEHADGAWPLGHPAGYEANDDLVHAVNTALILRKPLLVTGRPGTGKTELAERIAYEFDLGPVLRYEAQSLSEANDLFYRFDHIGQLIVARLVESQGARPDEADVRKFIQWGPLGKAILRSNPELAATLRAEEHRSGAIAGGGKGGPRAPKRSVVLIDEIDKASRDFPNDLLNGIERMEFQLREANSCIVKGAGRDSAHHPIVVVTSNSERDLPHPFMRRCVFAHIESPGRSQLAAIVRNRVFGARSGPSDGDGLPPLYSALLDGFIDLRESGELRYQIGTSELIDVGIALRRSGGDGQGAPSSRASPLERVIAALAKHPDDRRRILDRLEPLFHAYAAP